ncbi:MAG: M14 family zinc carboxypeptidase [Flavobacteriaceae bacterium]
MKTKVSFSEKKYQEIKVASIHGRYITNDHLEDFLHGHFEDLIGLIKGSSVLKKDIYSITLGKGPIKILMWSQMYGNESTTTKAVLDLVNFLFKGDALAESYLSRCQIRIIPILNPDGAEAYTRFNANEIDLNRDAQDLSQPESRFLRETYEAFQPDFCFNLHDQRTIFNVGTSEMPATVSFLAPAHDEERNTSASRALSMQLIAVMNKELQTQIAGQVGRYDDTFNANCVGDAFQMFGTPTVLVEAGHFSGDYDREETRKYVFSALQKAIEVICDGKLSDQNISDYLNIPENGKLFFDILVKHAHLLNARFKEDEQLGILYKEILKNKAISFQPYIEEKGNLNSKLGHLVLDLKNPSDLKKLKDTPVLYNLII